jgi:hypothetical protein
MHPLFLVQMVAKKRMIYDAVRKQKTAVEGANPWVEKFWSLTAMSVSWAVEDFQQTLGLHLDF